MKDSWFLLQSYEIVEFLCTRETLYLTTLISLMILLYLSSHIAKHVKQLQAIPGPCASVILLNIMKMAKDGTINRAHIFQKSGLCRIWIGHIPVVLVYKAETVECLLSTDDALDRAPDYQFAAPAFRNGLFTCPAREWRQRRKLLNPAFNVRIIEDCMPIFNKQSGVFVQKIKYLAQEMPLDVIPLSQHCSLDIICEAAMGTDIESQLGKNTDFVQATHDLLQILQKRALQFWLRPNLVFYNSPVGRRFLRSLKVMDAFTSKIILSRRNKMLNDSQLKEQIREGDKFSGKRKKLAFLDLLLYYHLFENKLTEIDVLGEVTTFMVAGHDTSGLTLAWALFLIGHDLRVQENIHKELDEVLSSDKERLITLTDIKKMSYLKCVIMESLRLYPPGSYVARTITNDIVINGYTIPSGTRCVGFIYQLHRDPCYFPKPEAFIPERFASNSPEMPAYTYIPFSAGPKVCIGQKFAMCELLTILADILRNFSLKSADARDKIGVGLEFVLVPANPLRVSFIPR